MTDLSVTSHKEKEFGYRVAVTTETTNVAPEVLIGAHKHILYASPQNPTIPTVGKVYFFQ